MRIVSSGARPRSDANLGPSPRSTTTATAGPEPDMPAPSAPKATALSATELSTPCTAEIILPLMVIAL